MSSSSEIDIDISNLSLDNNDPVQLFQLILHKLDIIEEKLDFLLQPDEEEKEEPIIFQESFTQRAESNSHNASNSNPLNQRYCENLPNNHPIQSNFVSVNHIR